MRRMAPLFALLLVLGLAACSGGGGGEAAGGDTVTGQDGTGTGGDSAAGTDSGTDPCVGISECALTDAPQCADTTSVQSCITNAAGCTVWSAPQACAADQTCQNGVCEGACVPDCTGKVCGDDGCGGTCAPGCAAGETCTAGQCTACVGDCTGKSCGDDGCGVSCGTCGANQTCNATGQCEGVCAPACNGKMCGPDGCGGTCGTCGAGFACNAAGACENVCVASCEGKLCGNDGCGGSCGFCPAGQDCVNGACQGCQANCTDRECGPDGCGASCGTCGADETCQAGQCIGCVANCEGKTCGGDGCGGSCGTCAAGQACDAGTCAACTANCEGKHCGNDGCGGSCGTCSDGLTCLGNTCVCVPDCDGKTCGDNGCGGSCGTCAAAEACVDGTCEACTPNCGAAVCGDDGCGGSCGACAVGESCQVGACVGGCVPDCTNNDCGSDGCGSVCGSCLPTERCTPAGQCVAETTGGCADYFFCANNCPDNDQACYAACYDALTPGGQTRYGNLVNCLQTRCATCYDGADVGTCLQNCAVAECTTDYGTCFYMDGMADCTMTYTCLDGCTEQACVTACYEELSPQGFVDVVAWQTCLADNCATCGAPDPSPADITQCNACAQTVADGVCNPEALACFGVCEPQCTDRECGADGCGGLCGSCTGGDVCNAAGACVPAGTGGNCSSYFDCAGGCPQGDTACIDTCRGTLGAASLALLDGYVTCANTNCAAATTNEEFSDCIIANCAAEYAGCVYEGGTVDCGPFYGCLVDCPDQACTDGCFDTVSPDAWVEAVLWENCIGEACPVCSDPAGTEQACVECTNAAGDGACAATTDACYGAACAADCAGKQCGFDGCGGYCGFCAEGACNDAGQCEVCVPECGANTCGPDGCGGSCGACAAGEGCVDGQCEAGACDNNGFSAAGGQTAEWSAQASALLYAADSSATDPTDSLYLEFWTDFGGVSAPGTYELAATAEEQNYATCGNCVLIGKGCTTGLGCEGAFFATGGTMTITSIGETGGTLTGTLTGVTMVQVTIDPDTYQSTPVDGGEGWCIDTFAFTAPITAAAQ